MFRANAGTDWVLSQTKGLTFVSVHDSYWTHAYGINEVSAVIRDNFIALHSSNVLSDLYEQVS